MYNSFFRLILIILISFTFIQIIYSSTISSFDLNNTAENETTEILDSEGSYFFWPIPGNHRFTSYFGKRKSPTSGASTYHSGVDIGASSRH